MAAIRHHSFLATCLASTNRSRAHNTDSSRARFGRLPRPVIYHRLATRSGCRPHGLMSLSSVPGAPLPPLIARPQAAPPDTPASDRCYLSARSVLPARAQRPSPVTSDPADLGRSASPLPPYQANGPILQSASHSRRASSEMLRWPRRLNGVFGEQGSSPGSAPDILRLVAARWTSRGARQELVRPGACRRVCRSL